MNTVAVVDYGMGNLHSVAKALEKVGSGAVRVAVTREPETVRVADRVVLPGVGAIGDCVGEMVRLGLDQVIREVAASKPFLGVCVGMQALLETSAESGGTAALGILPGRVERFPAELTDARSGEALKVPHMGWNQVHQAGGHPLWAGIGQDERFYFVHSYYVVPGEPGLTAATTEHGLTFTSAVARENLFATQFHPEKSQHAGLRLYANFLGWDGTA